MPYVGAVLVANGIRPAGQARAAALAPGDDAGSAAAHPTLLEHREVTVLNPFTGFVGVVCAGTLLIQAITTVTSRSIRGGGSPSPTSGRR